MLHYGIVSSFLLVLFFATANVFSYQEAIVNGFADIKTYYFLSQNEFTTNAINLFPSHHLERWVVHYLAGQLSRLTGFDIWEIYQSLVFLCIVAVTLLVSLLKDDNQNKMLFLSFLLLNPYTFRLYWAAPGMISDCLFYTTIIFFCYSIKYKKNRMLIVSSCLLMMFRQTGILLILPLALYAIVNKKNKDILLSSLASIFFIVTLFILTKHITESLYGKAEDGYFISHAFGVVFWLFNSFKFASLIFFFGRYFLFILSIAVVLYYLYLGFIEHNQKIRDNYVFVFVLAFVLIQLQPLAGGPGVTGGNIQRLAAFGIPFLVFLFPALASNKFYTMALVICLFFVSLHHKFTFLINIEHGNLIFLLLLASPMFYITYVWKKNASFSHHPLLQ